MLKRIGVEDVICFTYGKKGNREAEISRQVAESLGYRWFFVEYTHQKWYDCYRSEDMSKFFQYAGNLASIPHIQDFLAVKELKEAGKIPENAVIVPGHQGMVAGGLMHKGILAGNPVHHNRPEIYTVETLQKEISRYYYSLWDWVETSELSTIFNKKIQMSIGDVSIGNVEEYANIIELFEFKERKSKFIINSVRVYDTFTYGWRLPLLDRELIDFFLQVPLSYRINHLLYKNYAKELFTRQLQPLSEIECTTDLMVGRPLVKESAISSIRNYLFRLFKFDLGWASQYNHPLASRIMIALKGMDMEPFAQCPLISHIIKNNNKLHVAPSTNSLLTYDYLKHARAQITVPLSEI